MKKNVEKIDEKMTFREIVESHPDSVEFFFKKGFHCIGCPMASRESIKDGALAHGENPKKFIDELNKFLEKQNEKKLSK